MKTGIKLLPWRKGETDTLQPPAVAWWSNVEKKEHGIDRKSENMLTRLPLRNLPESSLAKDWHLKDTSFLLCALSLRQLSSNTIILQFCYYSFLFININVSFIFIELLKTKNIKQYSPFLFIIFSPSVFLFTWYIWTWLRDNINMW